MRDNTAMVNLARRTLLARAAAFAAAASFGGAQVSFAAAPDAARDRRLLVLVELKGGNDGFNTLVPYADAAYAALRPRIAIARDAVVQLSDAAGLHPSLAPLLPAWREGTLAVLQGVGYPVPNLSHFRSIEIWDTASRSDEFLSDGWLARAFAAAPRPATFAADGVVVGSNELGPLAGTKLRAIALADTESFQRRARLAKPATATGNRALAHIRKVEADVRDAAARLSVQREFATPFPSGGFGTAVRTACEVIANPSGVGVVRLTLDGFDTHANQPNTQARLLGELAGGLVALEAALRELGRWNDTLVLTYAEFGRRAKENQTNGTDHGTASAHFALGGSVRGGLYGAMPDLSRLDGDGNVAHTLDFRSVYASVMERWWGIGARDVLGGKFAEIALVKT
jgi:uncharacterized protein (DUF1501 family)